MEKNYIRTAPDTTRCPSYRHCSKTRHVVLDVYAAKVYRKYMIEPESPAKGDFVQNNALGNKI